MPHERTTRDGTPLTAKQHKALMERMVKGEEAKRMKRSWHLDPPDSYGLNPHILSWWQPEYDALLAGLIEEYGYGWHQEASTVLRNELPADQVELWRASDPLCEQYAYYNVLLNFAVARARVQGLEDELPAEAELTCSTCGEPFLSTSLKAGVWRDLGTDFCGVCLWRAFWLDGDALATKEEVVSFIERLYGIWQRVPPQTVSTRDVFGTAPEQRREIVRILMARPLPARVKELFGSWFHALVAARVLDGGAQQMARGVRCLALDGHLCLSIGEKTIDDLMHVHGIPHDKEPSYPEGRMRADFAVGDCLVEYFGLAGDAAYDAKIERKRALAREHRLELIEIFPKDLAEPAKFLERLQRAADAGQV